MKNFNWGPFEKSIGVGGHRMAVGLLKGLLMSFQIVIMPGSYRVDLSLVRSAAQDFGWAVHPARNLRELGEIGVRGKVGAVLFQSDSLVDGGSWLESISLLRGVAPETRLVGCTQFSEMVDLPKLCRSGLFHAVWLPLKENELRQCFGFVWESEKQRGALVARKTIKDSESNRVHIMSRAAS
jgi:hypothetical protein